MTICKLSTDKPNFPPCFFLFISWISGWRHYVIDVLTLSYAIFFRPLRSCCFESFDDQFFCMRSTWVVFLYVIWILPILIWAFASVDNFLLFENGKKFKTSDSVTYDCDCTTYCLRSQKLKLIPLHNYIWNLTNILISWTNQPLVVSIS